MTDDRELMKLTDLLVKLVIDLIDRNSANNNVIKKIPYYTKVVEYWPVEGHHSRELKVRKLDFTKLNSSLKPLLSQSNLFVELNEYCTKLICKYGSAPGTSGSPSAAQLILSYVRISGILKLNKEQVNIQTTKYLKALRSENIRVRTLVHIEGLAAAKRFKLAPEIILRPITKRDIGNFGVDAKLSSQHSSSVWMHESAWLCKISEISSKENAMTAWSNSERLVSTCISALRLANPKLNIRYLMICKDIPDRYLGSFRTSSGSAVPKHSHHYKRIDINTNKNQIQLTRKLFKEIFSLKKFEPQKCGNLNYALKKYSRALEREDRNDEIVDIATGLESLLCADSKSEISYRFKVRGSAVLNKSFGDSTARIALFSDIYSARSDVVHGNSRRDKLKYLKTEKLTTEERVNRLLPDARDAFSNILLWFLLNKESRSIRRRTSKHDSVFSYLDSKLADCESV